MLHLNQFYQALNVVPTDDFRCISSAEEITKYSWTLPYAHILREAFEDLGVKKILCIDHRPTIYIREDKRRLGAIEQIKFHKKLWNQGAATVCILFSPGNIDVISGMVQPNPSSKDQGFRLPVEQLQTVADVLELLNKIRTGRLYQEFPDAFLPDNTVDRTLVKNIVFARAKLIESGLSVGDAHAMLGRLIFLYFLTERGFIPNKDDPAKGKYSYYPEGISNPKELFNRLKTSELRKYLYQDLYPKLKRDYNGSMFDATLASEERLLTNKRIDIIKSFFRGDTLDTGQMALPFDIYDFKYIPVETISSLYEEFLKLESPSNKRKQGAYYTPKNLAEMVAEVALGGEVPRSDIRVLDPACGSGIFLVIIFNILAEIAIKRSPNAPKQKRSKARCLMELLEQQIRGVDVNETACRVTVFSLYLAYFEKLAPADVDDYRSYTNEPVLRSLMPTQNDASSKTDSVIRKQNFFAPDLCFEEKFDLIIGNPPWIGRNDLTKDQKEIVISWATRAQKTDLSDCLPKSKKNLLDVTLRQSQIAHAFMWKAPLHLKTKGKVCLLIPSKLFLNDTDAFQSHWLSRFKVEKAVMLSDYRRILFDQAICPAFVILYTNEKPNIEEDRLIYEVPKVSRLEVRPGAVTVEGDDIKSIKVKGLLAACNNNRAAAHWKQRFWGTPRDYKLISRLSSLPKLEEITDTRGRWNKRWSSGCGFQPCTDESKYDGEPPYKLEWSLEDKFLNADSPKIDMILCEGDFITLGKRLRDKGYSTKYLHRKKSEGHIFKQPMVLVNNGFTRCAFCEFDVRFQNSIHSIKGRLKDAKYLKFLAAYLNSPIAYYYQFHTSSSWGIERDKVSLDEVLQSPFFLPDSSSAVDDAELIIEEIASIIDQLKSDIQKSDLLFDREQAVAEVRCRTNELVYRYFDIIPEERVLIEDTVSIFEPSSTPTSLDGDVATLNPPTFDERKNYVAWLTKTLNQFSLPKSPRISAKGYYSDRLGLFVVTLSQTKKVETYAEFTDSGDLDNQLSRIEAYCRDEGRRISYRRGTCLFEGDRLHMIKPATLRNWCTTAALNDADSLIGYLQRNR